jgi:RNA polymerase sigma-70 factor (ECF subfamily)
MIGRDSAAPLSGAAEEDVHAEQTGASATLELPSFKSVYAQHFAFVWSSTRRLGVMPAAIDDVVQEIFMVIHGKLHTLQKPESLRSWIYSIVRRTVSSHHRSRRTRDASDAAFAVHTRTYGESQATPLDVTEHNEEAKLLWDLLGQLDESRRELLVLVEIEGMTVPEVSDILEIPLNTAYSRLRAARSAFDAALARRTLRERRGEQS